MDILSADKSSGHASGFDDSILDETGLLDESHRELVNGMRTAVSARDGRVIHLSIQGDSPFTAELLERKGEPGIAIHHYAAPEGCHLDDRDAWVAANPSLGTIKSWRYMEQAAARAIAIPADAATFRAFDLNEPTDPSRELIFPLSRLQACFVDVLPPREGHCYVGLDFGGSESASPQRQLCGLLRVAPSCTWPSGMSRTW